MANQLKMATVQSILHLHSLRWSGRRIAEELHVDRETVSRYARLARESAQADQSNSNPANAPIGSPAPGGSNPANAPIEPNRGHHEVVAALSKPATARSGPTSDCEPWREVIEAKRDEGLSARLK